MDVVRNAAHRGVEGVATRLHAAAHPAVRAREAMQRLVFPPLRAVYVWPGRGDRLLEAERDPLVLGAGGIRARGGEHKSTYTCVE